MPELIERSRATVSARWPALGVRPGDRVATLAWNSQAHVEAWYAIMGMGAVCHTLNPRLTAEQLGAMVGAVRGAHPDRQRRPRCRWPGRSPSGRPAIAQVLLIDGPAEARPDCAVARAC